MNLINSKKALHYTKVFVFFFVCGITSCFSHKDVFRQTLNDGTEMTGARTFRHKKENNYFRVVGKNEKQKFQVEFLLNRFTCDTIVKKIFKNGRAKVLILTDDIRPDYPISAEDKVVFEKAAPFLSPDNKCYSTFINMATGYKIVYEGKIKKPFF